MIPRHTFAVLGSPTYDAPGAYHPEIASWPNLTETLTRLVLTPLQCGTSNVHGYMIFGKCRTFRSELFSIFSHFFHFFHFSLFFTFSHFFTFFFLFSLFSLFLSYFFAAMSCFWEVLYRSSAQATR
jgi:hypothetical protein